MHNFQFGPLVKNHKLPPPPLQKMGGKKRFFEKMKNTFRGIAQLTHPLKKWGKSTFSKKIKNTFRGIAQLTKILFAQFPIWSPSALERQDRQTRQGEREWNP